MYHKRAVYSFYGASMYVDNTYSKRRGSYGRCMRGAVCCQRLWHDVSAIPYTYRINTLEIYHKIDLSDEYFSIVALSTWSFNQGLISICMIIYVR